MSFGVGIGDILLITKLGFTLWVDVRGAKKEREELTANLMEWRDKLKIVESMLADSQLSPPVDKLAKLAREQLSESLAILQVLEKLNRKLVEGEVFRQAAWEVRGREQFEKYQTELEKKTEMINLLFLCGSMAIVTDTARENNAILRGVENRMMHLDLPPNFEPIEFIDALNRERLIPFEWCLTLENFRSVIQINFRESAGKSFVNRGEYNIINEESGSLMRGQEWGNIIKPGSVLSMAIVIRKQLARCPACERQYNGPAGTGNELERVVCKFCGRWFQIQISSVPRIREIDHIEEQKQLDPGRINSKPTKNNELLT